MVLHFKEQEHLVFVLQDQPHVQYWSMANAVHSVTAKCLNRRRSAGRTR
jgi:hypothetical protein